MLYVLNFRDGEVHEISRAQLNKHNKRVIEALFCIPPEFKLRKIFSPAWLGKKEASQELLQVLLSEKELSE